MGTRQALLEGEKNKVKSAFFRTGHRRPTLWVPPAHLGCVVPHAEADLLPGLWRIAKFLWPHRVLETGSIS